MIWWMAWAGAEEPIPKELTEPVQWERCYPKHVRQEALCATIFVPVNHDDLINTESIPLQVVKLPAIRANAEPDPLFVLAGGPGQGASETIATLYPALRKIHQRRTLVFVDQRGTGQSNPLDCELPTDLKGDEIPTEALQMCHQSLEIEPQWYQTTHLAADTKWVSNHLGYQTINLYGVSYGTRLALSIMNTYPDIVRTATLDGIVPPNRAIGGDFGVAVRESLDRVFADCEGDEACRETFPSLKKEYQTLMQDLQNAEPYMVKHLDPVTGKPTQTEVSEQVLWAVIQQMLYQGVTASLIPHAIHNIANHQDWSTVVGWLGNSPFEGIPIGLYLSIICAEDAPRIDFSRAPKMDLGVQSTVQLQEMCAVWPTSSATVLDASWRSDIPTLLLSGAYDPVTPPQYGDEVLAHLTNATHVVAFGMGHNTIHQPCISDMVNDFVNTQNPQMLDVSCASSLQRPPFILSATGTAP